MHRVGPAIALLVCVGAVAGCGSGRSSDTVPSARQSNQEDCVTVWNASGNDRNRSVVVSAAASWRVQVSLSFVDHPATNSTGEGCGFLFSTDERWMSFSGAWLTDGGFEWQAELAQEDSRRPEQQIGQSNLTVQSDGTLR